MVHQGRLAAAAGVAAMAVAVAVFVVPSSGRGGPSGQLADVLDRIRPPARFVFAHQGSGTRVLDCFLPNRAVTGAVDLDAGVAVFTAPDGRVLARRTAQQALVHRGALAAGAVTAEWLAVELPASDEHRTALARALGADLAGYLLGDGLPADGVTTARAALDAAATVERLGTGEVDGSAVTGYRITLDRAAFAAAGTPSSTPTSGDEPVAPPLVDVWVRGDRLVARVAVQPTRPDGSAAEPEGGWTIDYRPGRALDTTAPRDVSPVGSVDLGALRGAGAGARGCEVPL